MTYNTIAETKVQIQEQPVGGIEKTVLLQAI
jgi:hypothetical protein